VTFSSNLIAAIGDTQQRPLIKLEIAWDGSEYIDESPYIIDASGVESIDANTGSLQPAEATITLDNLNQRYSAENDDSPIYPYIQGAFIDVRAKLSLGYYHAGQENYRQIGVFVVRQLLPQDSERTAILALSDISARFVDTPAFYGPVIDVSLDSVFANLAERAGLGTAQYRTAGSAFSTAQFAAAVGGGMSEEFGLLAIAEGGRVYVDNGGTLVFADNTTREAELRAPLISLDKGTFPFEISVLRNTSSAINRVTLEYEDRASAVSDETVWQITTPIKVPAAGTVTGSSVGTYFTPGQVTIAFNAQDQTRWIQYTPVVWATGTANPSAATANTDASGTAGTAIVMEAGDPASRLSLDGKLYYELTLGGTATGEGNRGRVIFRNMNSVPVYVRAFTLVGKPARMSSPYAVQADDGDGQDLLGGQILEQRILDPYLPSVDVSYQRAVDLLYFRSVRRVRVSMSSAPGIPLKAGEVFAVQDDARNITYLQQVSQIQWAFNAQNGYNCSIEGLPSLPGATSVQLGDFIPAITDVISTTEPQGPWYWAPDGDPTHSLLAWDGVTQWGPIEPAELLLDEVQAVSDSFTATVQLPLTWNTNNWDEQVWG
jgi:hypothetical protein